METTHPSHPSDHRSAERAETTPGEPEPTPAVTQAREPRGMELDEKLKRRLEQHYLEPGEVDRLAAAAAVQRAGHVGRHHFAGKTCGHYRPVSTTMAHTGSSWGGRRAQEWTRAVLALYRGSDGEPARCWLQLDGCLGVATTGDHVLPRKDRPDLAYSIANGRPACLPCNSKRQGTPLHRLHQLGGRRVSTIDATSFFDT